MKKGLSQVISTVLLIMLVVAVGGIIFFWAGGFFEKIQEKSSEENSCENNNFVIGDFCHEKKDIENVETGGFEEKINIQFNVRNDDAESELEGFMIFIDYYGGTIPVSSLMDSEIGKLDSKRIISDFIDNEENIEQIRIVPKIRKGNKVFICKKNEEMFYWGGIVEC